MGQIHYKKNLKNIQNILKFYNETGPREQRRTKYCDVKFRYLPFVHLQINVRNGNAMAVAQFLKSGHCTYKGNSIHLSMLDEDLSL